MTVVMNGDISILLEQRESADQEFTAGKWSAEMLLIHNLQLMG